jgi:hypothetical protein
MRFLAGSFKSGSFKCDHATPESDGQISMAAQGMTRAAAAISASAFSVLEERA